MLDITTCENLLIFEDDVCFTALDLNAEMKECFKDLDKVEWDLFYLGGNVNGALGYNPAQPYILQCNSILSTHAVCYSREARKLILAEMRKGIRRVGEQVEPFDQLLERVVQGRGKSYIANPLLATQRPGYSDILKTDVDWAPRIEDNFCKRVKEINK